MNIDEFWQRLKRQVVYAGILFCLFCLAVEAVFPGFAAPFVNIPWWCLACCLCAWFATAADQGRSRLRTGASMALYAVICLGGLAYLLAQLAPLGSMAWLRFAGVCATACLGFAVFLTKQEPR